MQVNTVHVELSIAKFALCWLAACHYLQNIITEPKNKYFLFATFSYQVE
jgi:nitric oxide reductase large subunit